MASHPTFCPLDLVCETPGPFNIQQAAPPPSSPQPVPLAASALPGLKDFIPLCCLSNWKQPPLTIGRMGPWHRFVDATRFVAEQPGLRDNKGSREQRVHSLLLSEEPGLAFWFFSPQRCTLSKLRGCVASRYWTAIQGEMYFIKGPMFVVSLGLLLSFGNPEV